MSVPRRAAHAGVPDSPGSERGVYRNTNERGSTSADTCPVPVRSRLRGGAAPARGAQLAVRAVPPAAALGTQPRGEPRPAPPPRVGIQAVTVRRMRRPPSRGGRRFKAPASGAQLAVRPVPLAAAPGAQPRGAVSVACSRGTGRQGAPRAVADVRAGRRRADGGRRQPASEAHGPGHPAVEPAAADHAPLDDRGRGQVAVPVRGGHVAVSHGTARRESEPGQRPPGR